MKIRIKICGITDPDTARVAVAAGADAIGMIFHPPSRRHLDLDQAAAISRAVGPFVATVAVMVNPKAEYIDAIINAVSPTHLQFHGEEPADFCASFCRPYIKALRVTDNIDLLDIESRYQSAQGILLDTHANEAYGGTGTTFDWARARYGGNKPVILAGGLTVENISTAIAQVLPYGVDISTGVESNGRKDTDKIRRFCRNVIAINQLNNINKE